MDGVVNVGRQTSQGRCSDNCLVIVFLKLALIIVVECECRIDVSRDPKDALFP